MSNELYKDFEKHALEIGIEKERVIDVYAYILDVAIGRLRAILKIYDRTKVDAIEEGMKNGMRKEDAEAMAKSFVNHKVTKRAAESWINSDDDNLLRILFWLRRQAKLYPVIYAASSSEDTAEIAYQIIATK